MRGSRRVRLAAGHAMLRTLAQRTWFVEDEIRGLAEVVAPGAVCLDVGAEYGLYTQVLSHLAGPRGSVHSLEPQPNPYRALCAGVRVTGAGNVRTYQLALGAEPGRGVLSVPQRGGFPVHGRAFLTTGARSLGANEEFTAAREIGVAVHTLDGFRERHRLPRVDFVKADVEGAELSVLLGAESTVDQFRPALLLEIENRHLAKYGTRGEEVVAWLSQRGYTAHRWSSSGWHEADTITDEQRNYLFLPR